MSGNADKCGILIPARPSHTERWRSLPESFRDARLCYDHLAGVLGVSIAEALVEQGALVERNGAGAVSPGRNTPASIPSHQWWQLGQNAPAVFSALGIDLADVQRRSIRRPLLRACLDWTEQEPHLAGHLGATLASSFFAQGWIRRQPTGRAIDLTAAGRRALSGRLLIQH
jgi:hypothetical protein